MKESETLEFKESLTQLKKSIISIVAILNKHKKGQLIFGVKDTGSIIGISIGKTTLRDVSKSISDYIEPKIYPSIKETILENKKCIVVDFEGKNIPYFAYGRAYVRIADEDKLLSSKELESLILKKNKSKLHWDKDICLNANLKDISKDKLMSFVKSINLQYISKENILKKLKLFSSKGITNSAIILYISAQAPTSTPSVGSSNI